MTRSGLKLSFYTAALALLISPFALTATADQPGDGWQRGDGKPSREQMREYIQNRIEALDTDGDGQVSFDEFQAPDKDRFSRLDQNGDGNLTLAEMKKSIAQRENERLERRFARMDGDGDGIVTRDEIRQQMFDKMDRNDDGYLTGRELRPRGHGEHGKRGGKGS
jgi:Ca2+-binding EF-hand superfamily protein